MCLAISNILNSACRASIKFGIESALTFADDSSEGIVAYDLDFGRGELLAKFIVRIGKLCPDVLAR